MFASSTSINTDTMQHYLCAYLHWINLPVAYYVYSHRLHANHWIDMVGIVILSIASSLYHYDIYKRLYANPQIKDNIILLKDNVVFFASDMVSIHLRSFLSVIANHSLSPYGVYVILGSWGLHLITMMSGILNIRFLFIYDSVTQHTFVKYNRILLFIPVTYDVISVCMHSPVEIYVPFLFVNIIIALLFAIKPFYKLTHVAFHVLILFQTYYICSSTVLQS